MSTKYCVFLEMNLHRLGRTDQVYASRIHQPSCHVQRFLDFNWHTHPHTIRKQTCNHDRHNPANWTSEQQILWTCMQACPTGAKGNAGVTWSARAQHTCHKAVEHAKQDESDERTHLESDYKLAAALQDSQQQNMSTFTRHQDLKQLGHKVSHHLTFAGKPTSKDNLDAVFKELQWQRLYQTFHPCMSSWLSIDAKSSQENKTTYSNFALLYLSLAEASRADPNQRHQFRNTGQRTGEDMDTVLCAIPSSWTLQVTHSVQFG